MATIRVQSFRVRSVVDGSTIIVTTFADGLTVREDLYGIPAYTVAAAEKDALTRAETFGVVNTSNGNMYEKEPTPTPTPAPAPEPVSNVEKDDKLKQPRYIPETRYNKPKSTRGGEYTVKKTGEDYVGKYIETFDKKYFAGTKPEENGVELQKVNEEFPIGLAFIAAPVVAGLLSGFFKAKLRKGDREKGFTKRYFVQEKKTSKIQETDQDTFMQVKRSPTMNLATVDWIIKGPAEDKNFNGYPYEGAASKNKKAIQALESQMPGISAYITDYSYLVEDPASTQKSVLSTTVEIERDPNVVQEDFRKARFDRRSDLIFPSASIFSTPAASAPTPATQSIITDGLTLYLDAGNTASYPGSGTTWTDLSGNGNNGTLVNGPTFDSANQGSIVFDGSDDQVQLAGVSLPTTSTVNLWIYPIPSSDSYGTLLTQGFFNGIWYAGATKQITYYYSGDHVTAQTLTENQWNNVVVVVNSGNVSFYINNVLDSNTFTGAPSLVVDSIGNDSISDSYKGKISNIQVYNRALSPAEITYNFNVLRTRYGI